MAQDKKDGNPKDSAGSKKVGVSNIPARVLGEVGLALNEGGLKYGPYNWRTAGVRGSVYYNAVFRHLAAWWEGENFDPDSGLSHVTKAIAGLMVLRDSMLHGNFNDDRPPAADPGWVNEQNAKAARLAAHYTNPAVTLLPVPPEPLVFESPRCEELPPAGFTSCVRKLGHDGACQWFPLAPADLEKIRHG